MAIEPYLLWASAAFIVVTFLVYLRNGLIMLKKLRTG